MNTAITIVGVVGCLVLLACLLMLVAMACAACFERASKRIVTAAKYEERAAIANHYLSTSWWFSEYPDAQHALKLVTQEIISGRCDSSRLRDEWMRDTGRKPNGTGH